MTSVTGKVVLITGGARGVGAEVARRLHARGARLLLVDLDEAPLTELAAELGDRVVTRIADVTDLASVEAAVAAGIEEFGGLDAWLGSNAAPGTSTSRAGSPWHAACDR